MAVDLALPFPAAAAPPTARAPSFEVAFGSGSVEDWAASVASIAVDAAVAPSVDSVEIVLGSGPTAPPVAVGDVGSVALGYADSGAEAVFTGKVQAVRRSLAGATRVLATNAGAALASLRVNQSYEKQSAGEIVADLAGRAGVATGAVEAGTRFAFYVVDDGGSAWSHVASLAGKSGFVASVDAGGDLCVGPYAEGEVAKAFAYGEDVLFLESSQAPAAAGTVTAVGEGAAGSEGEAAWSWLLKDATSVTETAGSGDRALLVADGSLRSSDAARAAAAGLASRAALGAVTARLLAPGTPAARVGAAVEVTGAPDGALDGAYVVRGVRHRYAKREGFTSLLLLAKSGAAGGAAGLLAAAGGLL